MSHTTYCYLWRVEREDGTVIAATDHDVSIEFNGDTFLPTVGVNTTTIVSKLGLAVDNLDVTGALDSEFIKEEDIEGGLYDNAAVDIYIVNWQDTDEYVHKVHGTFGTAVRTEVGYTTELRSQAQILNQPIGRTYQHTCDTKLGSARCGINLYDPQYSATGVVTSSSEGVLIVTTVETYDDGMFSLGHIETVEGYRYAIKDHSDSVITLWQPPSVQIEVGDALFVFAGCKQDADTCREKFNNINNFQGFPFIPGNDTITTYPVRGEDTYSGGSLFK